MENVSPHRTFFGALNNINNHFCLGIDCSVIVSAAESYSLVKQTEL
jgi:hypothetical protein